MRFASSVSAILTLVILTDDAPAQQQRLELFIQTGHTQGVTSVAISHDAKLVLTGSEDGSAILWDSASGKSLQTFQHTYATRSVALSADGKLVVTIAETVILWEAASGKKVHTLDVASANVALSGDSKFVVTSSNDGAVLWDAASGKKVHTFAGPVFAGDVKKRPIWSVAVSDDAKLIAGGGYAHTAMLWELGGDKKELHTFKDKRGSGGDARVALSADGKYLLAMLDPSKVVLFDTVSGKKLQSIDPRWSLRSMALSRDGKHVVIGSQDYLEEYDGRKLIFQMASLWELDTGKIIQTYKEHAGTITSVALSGDGNFVVTGSKDGTAILWDKISGKKIQTFQRPIVSITDMALSGDGNHLTTALRGPYTGDSSIPGKSVTLWRPRGAEKLDIWPAHREAIGLVALTHDGSRVATSAIFTTILWDAASGKKLQTFEGDKGEPAIRASYWLEGLAMSRDGKVVATRAAGSMVQLWDSATGMRSHPLKYSIHAMALSGDGKHLLTAGYTDVQPMGGAFDEFALWEIASGKKLKAFRKPYRPNASFHVSNIVLAGDSSRFVTSSNDVEVKKAILWDFASGKDIRTFEGHTSSILGVALSRDGKFLLTGSHDKTAILWDTTGKKLQVFQHPEGVWRVAMSGDGKHVWTACFDGSIRLWDPATGKERCRLHTLDAGKDWLVVTPEGLFDGSKGAWRYVTYRDLDTRKLVDDDATRQRFHRPGLLANLWSTSK